MFLRSFGLYTINIFFLLVYSIKVCPFIEDLSESNKIELVLVFGIPTLLLLGIRHLKYKKMLEGNKMSLVNLFLLDIIIWIVNGLAIGVINFLIYDFPLGSALKVLVGCLSIGGFSAAILSLLEESRFLNDESNSFKNRLSEERFISITKKFAVFSGICLIEFTVITLIIIYKDLLYIREVILSDVGAAGVDYMFLSIAKEIFFVLAVLLLYSFVILYLYARNLKCIFRQILSSLSRVETGDLGAEVPILTTDEFSIISRSTNKMIQGLREKEHIRQVFGKYVSPGIANEVLSQSESNILKGKRVEVAVLFSDIRDFTSISENRTPEETVEMLNLYFSYFVNVIHKHNGILDKFIGDAVMAIFRVSADCENPCEAAVQASLEMRGQLEVVNSELRSRGLPEINNGTGIHFGEAVSGNIGSAERLEYTVIGDTVNTASRLEESTKGVKSPVVISSKVFEHLSALTSRNFVSEGDLFLKGKGEPTSIYKFVS